MNREAATFTINQRLTASDPPSEVRFESDMDGSITNLKVVQIRFYHHKPNLTRLT